MPRREPQLDGRFHRIFTARHHSSAHVFVLSVRRYCDARHPSDRSPVEEFYFKWLVAAAVFFVVLEIAYLTFAGLPPIGKPWVDATNFVYGRDFLNTWMGGRSMFSGGPAAWFDARTYAGVLHDMLGPKYPETYWSYPPHIVLFVWPLGLTPYLPAYIAWCVIGIGLYLFACSSAIPRERLKFLAVAPGVAVCVFFGQNGFYTAALLIGVLERRWLTIASAAMTAAVLFVATAMLFGLDVWLDYWHKIVPQQMWLTDNADGLMFSLVSSLLFGARLIHLPLGVARAVQYAGSAFAVAAVVWTYWKRRDPALSLALFVTATFLFSPYILKLRHGDVRLRGGAAPRSPRQHHARPLAPARGLEPAGNDDVCRRDLDSGGAGRADHVRVLAAASSGTRR